MTQPRRLLRVGVGLAGVGMFGFLMVCWLLRMPEIDRAAFDAIEMGMSEKEVEALLGGPPGDRKRRSGQIGGGVITATTIPGASFRLKVWSGEFLAVSVGFDEKGRVQAKFLEGVAPGPPQLNIFERFLRMCSRLLWPAVRE